MLEGTGLRYRATGRGTYTILAQATQDPPTQLGADQPAPSETEIIVTAQKREERLQDVPMAITALTGEDIDRRGASTLLDLQYSIPGLSLLENGPGQERIQMRGISSANGLPTIGRYVDEMPISVDLQGIGLEVRLLDVERIEVLRGPQGTLYGEGSMGGTIRYLTTDPDLNRFGGNFEAQAGGVSDGGTAWRTNAAVNLPLIQDRVGLRLVAGYEDTGGWIDSAVTGDQDVNAATISQLRGKLLVRFTDTIEGSLLVMHQQHDQDYQNFGVDHESGSLAPEFNNQDADLVNGILRWDVGFAELVYSVGYIDATSETQTDVSSIYAPFLAPYGPPGYVTSVGLGTRYDFELLTHEMRLASRPGGVLDWTVGVYGRTLETVATTSTPTAPGAPPFIVLGGDVTTESESWAAFGELDWHATERLTVALGLRYFEEDRTFNGTSISFGFPTPIGNAGSFDSLNPRLNVSYEFSPDSMVYFNAAKGFRSGGFNRVAVGTPPTFDPETLWTYEVGTKQQWDDRRVTFEGAVYYNDWKDVQSTFFPPASVFGYTVNSGHVAGWGVDLSLTARPTDYLTLNATYGWDNLEYQEASAEKNEGDPIDYGIQETWSASIDYRRPVWSDTEGFARLDYQHAGESAYINRGFGSIVAVDSRDTINTRLGLDFGAYQVALFADNLTNEDTPIIPGPLGVIIQDLEAIPRVVGVNFRASY